MEVGDGGGLDVLLAQQLHLHRRVGEVERKVVQEVRQVGGGAVDHRQGVAGPRRLPLPLPPAAAAARLGEGPLHELPGEGPQVVAAQRGQLVGVGVEHAAAPVGLPLLVHEAAVPAARLQAGAADGVVLMGEERRRPGGAEVGVVVRMRLRLVWVVMMMMGGVVMMGVEVVVMVVVIGPTFLVRRRRSRRSRRRRRRSSSGVSGGRGEVGRRSRAHGLHLRVAHDAAELPAAGVVVIVAAMPPLPLLCLLQEVFRQQRWGFNVLVTRPGLTCTAADTNQVQESKKRQRKQHLD